MFVNEGAPHSVLFKQRWRAVASVAAARRYAMLPKSSEDEAFDAEPRRRQSAEQETNQLIKS